MIRFIKLSEQLPDEGASEVWVNVAHIVKLHETGCNETKIILSAAPDLVVFESVSSIMENIASVGLGLQHFVATFR